MTQSCISGHVPVLSGSRSVNPSPLSAACDPRPPLAGRIGMPDHADDGFTIRPPPRAFWRRDACQFPAAKPFSMLRMADNGAAR